MIFLDTNFIITYYLKNDKYHDRAVKIWKTLEDREMIISRTIIVEVFNILNTRLKENIELSKKVYKFILDKPIVLDDHFYHDKAFKLMSEFYNDSKRVQFADCIYMTLMKQLEINKIARF